MHSTSGAWKEYSFPAALALLLRADLIGTREWPGEYRLEVRVACNLAPDVANEPAEDQKRIGSVFASSRLTARPATVRMPEIRQSIEIFSRHCLRHCRPQQSGRNSGNGREDQKTFPMALGLEKKASCGGADRSGDGHQ